jgi:hypothetical protein
MTIYVLTFKATASHDAEKRAGLNRFLKAALRSYGLRLIEIETKEDVETPPARVALYKDSATLDEPIGYYDYGSSIPLVPKS